MPRGIPNAKRDDAGMRFTTFHVPLPPNPKHLGTTYLKSESQAIWARNAKGKAPEVASVIDSRRGSHVLVIHPGSRWLRMGRASDVSPVSVPNVIARKQKGPVPVPTLIEGISRPQGKSRASSSALGASGSQTGGDEYAVPIPSDDPVEAKIAAIAISLRDRMRFYKLRVTPNAATIASTFNEQFKPEIIAEYNDPFRIDWIQGTVDHEYLVGEKVFQLADPTTQGYVVRWPIYGTSFNLRDYTALQLVLADVECIWRSVLKDKLQIDPSSYKDYSVILVIPDFYERVYVRELVNIVLVQMGFKQVCAQQESLAATYGAGISNACVIDIGATSTSIACVDEGLVIADTRMCLSMGGDDITEFLYVLLDRIGFPYRDINLARQYDWDVMEDLKARLCTLAEGDVALNLYDFVVRRPGEATEKYGLRAYDEIILAPMCVFEPRVIEFDRKRVGMRSAGHPNVTEDILDQPSDIITQAMIISTSHLQPQLQPVVPEAANPQDQVAFEVAPQPAEQNATTGSSAASLSDFATVPGLAATEFVSLGASDFGAPVDGAGDTVLAGHTETTADSEPIQDTAESEINGVLDGTTETKPLVASQQVDAASASAAATSPGPALAPLASVYPVIDVWFEASKLPLDVAIFNSARAAGGDDKIRKYLQAVLVVGGTALIPGMAHALESRLQAIATPLVPNMEKVQIIPPPKDVDPRVLVWKGASVLGKMDGVADLWVTAADWDVLGMRGLKERCFYL